MSGKQKHWIERRAESARVVARMCDRCMVMISAEMPFAGKTEVLKRISDAMNEAKELAWDLEIDAGDAKRREEGRER